MPTLATLQQWREELISARAAGVKSVDYDGKTVTYRSDAEMARALRDLERRIEQADGAGGRGPIRVTTHKGV